MRTTIKKADITIDDARKAISKVRASLRHMIERGEGNATHAAYALVVLDRVSKAEKRFARERIENEDTPQ